MPGLHHLTSVNKKANDFMGNASIHYYLNVTAATVLSLSHISVLVVVCCWWKPPNGRRMPQRSTPKRDSPSTLAVEERARTKATVANTRS